MPDATVLAGFAAGAAPPLLATLWAWNPLLLRDDLDVSALSSTFSSLDGSSYGFTSSFHGTHVAGTIAAAMDKTHIDAHGLCRTQSGN